MNSIELYALNILFLLNGDNMAKLFGTTKRTLDRDISFLSVNGYIIKETSTIQRVEPNKAGHLNVEDNC